MREIYFVGKDEKFVYSEDGEIFTTYDKVISDLELMYGPGRYEIYRGIRVDVSHKNFINGEEIICNIQEKCWGDHLEYADDYLIDLKNNAAKELEALIDNWLISKTGKPSFYHVTDIAMVEIDVEE
jgi:hypothetical protein